MTRGYSVIFSDCKMCPITDPPDAPRSPRLAAGEFEGDGWGASVRVQHIVDRCLKTCWTPTEPSLIRSEGR